jgi:hypothetical protein
VNAAPVRAAIAIIHCLGGIGAAIDSTFPAGWGCQYGWYQPAAVRRPFSAAKPDSLQQDRGLKCGGKIKA